MQPTLKQISHPREHCSSFQQKALEDTAMAQVFHSQESHICYMAHYNGHDASGTKLKQRLHFFQDSLLY